MGKVVCVTGASGYIASWLVKVLLHRGYTVRATVRSLGDPSKVVHLKAFEGAEERLHLFEANLLTEGSFDTAVNGCECVFHTASPVLFETTDPQKELIDPALKGTLNVLNSCKKVASLKRVVITSSMSALMFARNPPRPDFIDESWFSDRSICEERKQWYSLAKTLAQEAAWKFAEENDMDLVMLHFGCVFGPLLQPTINFVFKTLVDLLKEGKDYVSGGGNTYVHIRDAVEAHILAFENPSASGRYCVVGKVANSFEVAEILKRIFPSLNLPSNITENRPANPTYEVSREKAESLGLKFTPLEVILKDTVESLKENNFISF